MQVKCTSPFACGDSVLSECLYPRSCPSDFQGQSFQANGNESWRPMSWLWRRVVVLECRREHIIRVWGNFTSTQAPKAPGPPLESGINTEMSQGDRDGSRGRGPYVWQRSKKGGHKWLDKRSQRARTCFALELVPSVSGLTLSYWPVDPFHSPILSWEEARPRGWPTHPNLSEIFTVLAMKVSWPGQPVWSGMAGHPT